MLVKHLLWYHKRKEINIRDSVVNNFYRLNVLASTYGSSSYSSSSYNGQATTGSGTGTGASGHGNLSNTGVAIVSIITLAAVILLTAMVVRIWRRPAKVTEPVEAVRDDNASDN